MVTEVEEGSHGSQSPPTEWQVRLFLILPLSLNWNLLTENLQASLKLSIAVSTPPSLTFVHLSLYLSFRVAIPEVSWLLDLNTISLILSTTSHPILGTGPHISFSSSFCQARLFGSPKGRLFNNCLSSPHPHALPSPARPAAGACIHPTLPGLAPRACKQRLHPRDGVGASISPAIYLRTRRGGDSQHRAPTPTPPAPYRAPIQSHSYF